MHSILQRGCSSLRRPHLLTHTAAAVLPRSAAASSSFHSACALSAAPAKPAAAGAPAGAAAAGGKPGAPITGPPAPGSARYVAEGWGAAPLVPKVMPALKSAEDVALDAAELAASLVLPELHATVREQIGSKHSQWMRRQRLRIPGVITDRSNPRQNQLFIDIDRFELEQLCRKYRRSVGHRVCLMHVEGMAEPIKVIPEEIQRHAVTQELLVANWFIFKPRQDKIKVQIPVVFTGSEECLGVKRGGVLVILREKVPCVWTGGDNIPPFIHINLTNADGGKVFRNEDFNLPEGLRVANPQEDYVVATVLGLKTKGREEDDEPVVGVVAPVVRQLSATEIEREKKAKERREEEEMVAQKLAQAKAKK